MTHTPGPWYVYGPAAECVATDALGERGVLVAQASLHGTDYKADARLIAAAPELYSSLCAAVEYAPHGEACSEGECMCWQRYARAALAKATGADLRAAAEDPIAKAEGRS